MLRLPDVTLIALTGKDYQKHMDAFEESSRKIVFGAVKLIWRDDIKSIDDWNRAVFYDLGDHVTTSHALLIHPDGYVRHPESWDDAWLELDYIGSPWPLPQDDYSYRDIHGVVQRIGNSVSLRSKKLMDLPKKLDMPFAYFHGNNNEDGAICVNYRHIFEEHGCTFGTFEQALRFGKEHELPEHEGLKPFVFHEL